MRWELVLERRTRNRLNPAITRKKLKAIAAVAERNRSLGFEGKVGQLGEPELVQDEGTKEEVYRYLVRLRLIRNAVRSDEAAHRQFEHVLKVVSRKAQSEGWKVRGPTETSLNSEVSEGVPRGTVKSSPRSGFKVPALTDEVFHTFLQGVYEREAQVRTLHAAVETCVQTDGRKLDHCLLYGEPGACKTKLMERLKAWYEAGENAGFERMLFVDGTTMTKAGLEKWLLELAELQALPDVLVVDELEKQPMDNLLCLNAVMGSGVLTKLNARTGNVRRQARFVVVGICNDEQALKTFRAGALWSRFTHEIYCPRPSYDLCLKILTEMLLEYPDGKPEWAEKALEFGWNALGQRDIRKLKGHLNGRDRLLDGSWQKDQLAIAEAERREKQENRPA